MRCQCAEKQYDNTNEDCNRTPGYRLLPFENSYVAATTAYPTFPHDNLANPPKQANQPEDDEEPPPDTVKKVIFHRLLHWVSTR